ncbi:hypothetical protein [Burkholderia sp. LMG 13014]|uniref:hypothetical protein n=1 Tax=Burkholderia sp. LMG 13014 TaxID=2709306 RepID=UPI001962B9DF|nr:hypothetical protein [Burkholderia sp. LMG 13014]
MAKSTTPEIVKPHPLLVDYWVSQDDPEHLTVGTQSIGDITRATDSIRTLARLAHNSLSEPSMSGEQPLDMGTVRALLCGIEVMGLYIYDQTELMRERAASIAKYQRDQEAKNG